MVEISYTKMYKALCDMLKPVTEDYLFEVSLLCSHFLNADKAYLISHNPPISAEQQEALENAAKKRLQNYPLQYILGEWEFYGRKFEVGEGVLIPRADTETLIEHILEYANCVKNKPDLKVLDLCSGSGCIAVTLALELDNVSVYALEKSEQAFEYMLRNISKNNAKVIPILGDALNPPEGLDSFDIIVSNPPYLTKEDMQSLQREVAFEPKMALYGEDNGLYFYTKLTEIWKSRINDGGLLAYEIGINQELSVEQILKESGFKTICQRRDLCDIIRVISGAKIVNSVETCSAGNYL